VGRGGEPVVYAQIILQTTDSIVVKSELTDENGIFTIKDVANGTYLLNIKYFSENIFSQIINVNGNLDLETIVADEGLTLGEVTITAQKPLIEKEVDRLIFNVENSISASSGDAIDALKVTPNIRVKNGKISMIGKSGMGLMIDDRLIPLSGDDLINFLKTISADNIKSIEVITAPPAQYSAEGNSGLVNIILKKAKKDSWNASLNSTYKQATYATGSVFGNFNFQKNKISLFSNLDFSNGATGPVETAKVYYQEQLWSTTDDRKDFDNYISGRIGIDYQISKKISTGIQYLGSSSKPNIEENILTTITHSLNNINSYIKTNANNKRKKYTNSLNWHALYEIDTIGTKISTDFDYFQFNGEDDRIFKSDSLDSFENIAPDTYISANNNSKNGFSNYSGNIAVEMPLKWANLLYGGKISFNKNISDFSYFDLTNGNPVFDPSQSNQFKYDENTVALYFSGTKQISQKWEAQIGLRMESTKTKGVSVTLNQEKSNNYTKIFPTVYITYEHNENNMFSLNYSRRINRPPFYSLNPFRWYENQYIYSEGNPFLQPSYSHNFEFAFTHKQNWENIIYFSKTDNGISQITLTDNNTNIISTKFSNSFNTEIIGLSESYTFDKVKFWESYNSLDLSYSKASSLISYTNQKREGFSTYLSTDNTFFINKKKTVVLNLNFWLSPKGVSDLDKNTSSSQLDLALKWLLLNKDLQISFIVNDLTRGNRPTYISYSNNLKQEFNSYYDNRSFKVSITYKFGNKDINVEKRGFGNDEEKSRTK